MFPFIFDPTFMVLIPALVLSIWAQARIRSAFGRYSEVRARRGVTARDAARAILDSNGLSDVPVERVQGALTDHYDPRKKVLRLSDNVYGSPSIAAIGVAAHEAGQVRRGSRRARYHEAAGGFLVQAVHQIRLKAVIPLHRIHKACAYAFPRLHGKPARLV